MKRQVDAEKLREWISNKGPHGLTELAEQTKMSVHTLYRMSGGGYKNEPNPITRKVLCEVTGMSEDELFPLQRDRAS